MITVTKTVYFKEPPKRIFAIMTNNKSYQWRSDIKKIDEIEHGRSFIEYTKKNVPTLFNITKRIPSKEYCFTMDNNNLHGKWSGVFEEKDKGTVLTLTETIEPKKRWMEPLVRHYLTKQQNTYIKDLSMALKMK